ncbi:hypothetical protein AO978_32335 [Pseudomonas aeruginosa]|nr:hypothetical protein AO978_32335 [Pseudomonas aeruginosa]OPE09273.1 hypothetical protein APA58_33585 [Pseudomonas aeruginosa]
MFEVESTHRLGLASAEEDGRHFARATRALAFFNGLLEPMVPVDCGAFERCWEDSTDTKTTNRQRGNYA